jgi:hypothetical protein
MSKVDLIEWKEIYDLIILFCKAYWCDLRLLWYFR